jgi:hypothetical protein
VHALLLSPRAASCSANTQHARARSRLRCMPRRCKCSCWCFLASAADHCDDCAFLNMNGLSSLSRKSQLPGLARLAALRIANAKKIQGSSDGRVAGISYFAANPLHNIHEHQSSDDPTLFSKEDSNPDKLTERYNALRDWIHRCLDTFRGELRQLL